ENDYERRSLRPFSFERPTSVELTYAGLPLEIALISTGAECSEEYGPESRCERRRVAVRGSVEEAGSDRGGHGIRRAAFGIVAGQVRRRHAPGQSLPGETDRGRVEDSAIGKKCGW